MTIASRLRQALVLLEEPTVLIAIVQTRPFSITSFRMVRTIARMGIAPSTVIDVGANVGQFTSAARHEWAQTVIHCVEPLPDAVMRLRRIADANHFTIHPVAVGDHDGEAVLRRNVNSVSSSVLPLSSGHLTAFPKAVEIGTVVVPMRTLDTIFVGRRLDPPVLLKLDVQGFEAAVLNGATRLLQEVEWVVVEGSISPMYAGERPLIDTLTLMQRAGFGLVSVVGHLKNPNTGAIIQVDVLFQRQLPS